MITAGIVGQLPGSLANSTVTVGGTGAPMSSIGRNAGGQETLTFQVPCEVNAGSSVPVVVKQAAQRIRQHSDSGRQPRHLHADGRRGDAGGRSPAGRLFVTPTNPARRHFDRVGYRHGTVHPGGRHELGRGSQLDYRSPGDGDCRNGWPRSAADLGADVSGPSGRVAGAVHCAFGYCYRESDVFDLGGAQRVEHADLERLGSDPDTVNRPSFVDQKGD